MALEIFVGQTALPTASTGTTDLTSADSSTVPVGVLHNASRVASPDISGGDFVFNIGMADGTLERAISSNTNDIQPADDASKGYYDGCIAQTTPGTTSEEGLVNHNSFIAGGQRIDNTNGFFNAALCSHMFFAGCNYTVEEVVLDADVDVAVNVDPGHAWDVVLVTQCRETVLGDEDPDNNASFGFMTKADDSQACIATLTDNNDANPGNPVLQISEIYAGMVQNPVSGALLIGIDVQEGTGTSCDVFPRVNGGESVLVALTFIGFTDGSSAKIVSWDSPSATGNNAVTGAGGEPIALIHLLSKAAAYDVAEADGDAGSLGVGFVTADSEFCVSAMNKFNTGGNSLCKNISSAQSIKVKRHDGNSGAGNSFDASYVSMDSDGWTDNWATIVTGGGLKQISLAFMGASIPAVGLSVSTEEALALTSDKDVTVGLVTETDISLDVITPGLGGLVGLPVEVDEALIVTRAGLLTLGLLTEVDSALAAVPRHDVDANRVFGTDEALSLTIGLATEPTLVTENDSALGITRVKIPDLPIVIETDLATGVFFGDQLFVGVAQETSEALPVISFAAGTLGLVIEIDSVPTARPVKAYSPVGLPSETDSAFAVSVSQVIVPVDLGWEDDEKTWGGIELTSKDFAPVFLDGTEFYAMGYDPTIALSVYLERKSAVHHNGYPLQGQIVWPQFLGPNGYSIQISLGASDTPDGPIDWEGPYDFIIGETTSLDYMITGKYLAIRFASSNVPAWTLQSYGIDYELLGRY